MSQPQGGPGPAGPAGAGPAGPGPANPDPSGPGPAGPDSADRWDLRLYVTGRSPRSLQAIENLKLACEAHLGGHYQIEVVDLLDNPRLAADDQILAVPTVVRKMPPPMRRIVGDLSDTGRLLDGLQLPPPRSTSP